MRRLRRDSRRQVVYDLLLWAVLGIFVAAMGPDPLKDPAAFGMVTVPRIGLASVAVLVGRRWPLAALVLLLPLGPWRFSEGFATVDLSWLLPRRDVKILPLLATSPFIMWYAYLTGRRLAAIWPALVAFFLISVVGVGVVLARGGDLALWVSMMTGLLGTYVVPYLLGLLRRRLLQQRTQARLSAEAQARLRERARIARDMHDSLGHDLALIAVRAAGLELAAGLDQAHVRAAGELRLAAADATERLRQIIGLLREESDVAPLSPVDEDVAELVRRARDSGMPITLDLAPGPVPDLAHAVVQEGLTNAAKHAPGAAVAVRVAPDRVTGSVEHTSENPSQRCGYRVT
ncbi:histidine kinase [Nonomuraea sp. NPDC049784]|uniref:sensor histidine kinase n=1 Tax=Nonomuraea sp. NPDC049784 TaxID=3154361 RepID=UPI0034044968